MEGQDASPILYVNGKRHVMPEGKAEQTLLAYLRGGCLPNSICKRHVTELYRPRRRPSSRPSPHLPGGAHAEPPASIRTQASG